MNTRDHRRLIRLLTWGAATAVVSTAALVIGAAYAAPRVADHVCGAMTARLEALDGQ